MPNYACLDVETTGLDSNRCRVLEIAVVQVDNGVLGEEWSTLLDPKVSDVGPTTIHGITLDLLSGAPSFAEVAGDFVDLLDGRIPVAHNAPFDVGFLVSEWDRIGWGPLGLQALDTLSLARALGLPGRLGDLAEALSIDLPGAHRALDDTRALAQVLLELLERAESGWIDLPDVPPFHLDTFGPSPSGKSKARTSS